MRRYDSMFENYGYNSTKLTSLPNTSKFSDIDHRYYSINRMFKNYGHNCVFNDLHLTYWRTYYVQEDECYESFKGLKLRRITLSAYLSIDMVRAGLTNSKGEEKAT